MRGRISAPLHLEARRRALQHPGQTDHGAAPKILGSLGRMHRRPGQAVEVDAARDAILAAMRAADCKASLLAPAFSSS